MHRLVARTGHAEADHALLVADFLDGPLGLLRRVERQIDQRFYPVVAGQYPVDQPAVIGAAEPHFHFRLRMHAEKQHRRREHHHVVDAERIHRPARQDDVAMHVGLLDDFALPVLMRDAAADRLVAQVRGRRSIHKAARRPARTETASRCRARRGLRYRSPSLSRTRSRRDGHRYRRRTSPAGRAGCALRLAWARMSRVSVWTLISWIAEYCGPILP